MRERLTTGLELIGAAVVAAGCGLIYLPAGIIVAGLALIGAAYLADGDGT